MSDVRDLLVRGSEKIIDHYRLLLAGAKSEKECKLYRSRIDREQKLLDELQGRVSGGSPRKRCFRL